MKNLRTFPQQWKLCPAKPNPPFLQLLSQDLSFPETHKHTEKPKRSHRKQESADDAEFKPETPAPVKKAPRLIDDDHSDADQGGETPDPEKAKTKTRERWSVAQLTKKDEILNAHAKATIPELARLVADAGIGKNYEQASARLQSVGCHETTLYSSLSAAMNWGIRAVCFPRERRPSTSGGSASMLIGQADLKIPLLLRLCSLRVLFSQLFIRFGVSPMGWK